MYKITVRTAKYDTQLLINKFGNQTKEAISKKVHEFNIQKLGKKMAKLFGPVKPRQISQLWTY